jgi:hypothetical protein
MNDRPVRESRELTDRERAEAYKKSFYQSHLPDLPPIPGYHICWLTTTNPRDSIAGRMRLGYEPIKASEVPGFEHIHVKSGDYIGCIGVNEMLAFKVPLHLWETYMRISHHDQPLEEEGSIVSEVEKHQSQLDQGVGRIVMEEGTAALGHGPAPPVFADEYGEH